MDQIHRSGNVPAGSVIRFVAYSLASEQVEEQNLYACRQQDDLRRKR